MRHSIKKILGDKYPAWRERLGQLIRFGIVGVVASIIHYGVYCLMLQVVGAGATLSFTAGYAISLLCNYFMTTYFTFRSRPSSKNAVGFGFSHLINYLIEVGLLNLFLWIGIGKLIAPLVVLVVAVPINFTILHFVYTYKIQ
jgi:putative flippase GtrA